MATVIKSIGSNARDYTSVQAFIDSIPTDVVGSGNSYIGELYNDSEFNDTTGKFTLAGKTTDSTHFITLRCAAGQSFNTNANKANNALWYNQSNGVAIKVTAGSATAATVSVAYTVIDGLQIWASGSSSMSLNLTGANAVAKNCILMAQPASNPNVWGVASGGNSTILNCLIVNNVSGNGSGVMLSNGTLVNCTIVKPNSLVLGGDSAKGVYFNFNTCVVKNCAIFGFLNRDMTPNSFSASDYNASDWSQAPGGTAATHNKLSLVYANQFVSINNDFRVKSGSDLIDAGNNLSATYSSADILGTGRQVPWDIGAYEMPVPATTVTLSGPSLGKNHVASTAFTVGANGSISSANTVSLSDNGAGGTFSPTSVQLLGANPSATFTYTPATTGNITISITNSGGLTNPASATYASVNVATAITLTAPTSAGRAGVQSGNFTAATNGYVDAAVTVIPNDGGDGGSFNPPFVSLDNLTTSATFTYVGASSGVKTISTTNNGGLADNSVTITEKPAIVAVPTPSTSSLVVKSIGTGKDYATLKAFTDFAATFDLSANQQSLMGEVYENQTVATTSALVSRNATVDFKLILQPVPGTSVNVLDIGDPFNYGTEGIELTFVSSTPFQIGRGAVIQDFRLNVTAAASIGMFSGNTNNDPFPTMKRCRLKTSSSANALQIGQFLTPGIIQDSLLIQDDGSTGSLISASSYVTVQRSSLIRRGNATGTPVALTNSQGTAASSKFNDTVLINCGAAPITNIDLVTTANLFNNFADNTWTTPRTGFTTVLASSGTLLVTNTTSDFRPADNGGLVGQASASAIDSLDIYSSTRGGAPDVGCVQGSIVNLLPKVSITVQDVNAQSVTVSGTTQYSPTSGTALLIPDATTPNGAVQQGPVNVTLGSGTFTITFTNVPAGNYQIPQLTLVNAQGYNRSQTGGATVAIIPVTAAIVAGEAAPTVGNAPGITVDQHGFDNTTFSVNGTVDNQGDSACSIVMYLDPVPSGTSRGPFTANIIGTKWAVQYTGIDGNFKVRVVGTANSQTTTVIGDVIKVITYTASFSLPDPAAP